MTHQKITENIRRPTNVLSSPGMFFSNIYESLTNRKRGSAGFQQIDTRESVDLESPNHSGDACKFKPTSKGFHFRLRSWRKLTAIVGATLLIVTLLGCWVSPLRTRRRMPTEQEIADALEQVEAFEFDAGTKVKSFELDQWSAKFYKLRSLEPDLRETLDKIYNGNTLFSKYQIVMTLSQMLEKLEMEKLDRLDQQVAPHDGIRAAVQSAVDEMKDKVQDFEQVAYKREVNDAKIVSLSMEAMELLLDATGDDEHLFGVIVELQQRYLPPRKFLKGQLPDEIRAAVQSDVNEMKDQLKTTREIINSEKDKVQDFEQVLKRYETLSAKIEKSKSTPTSALSLLKQQQAALMSSQEYRAAVTYKREVEDAEIVSVTVKALEWLLAIDDEHFPDTICRLQQDLEECLETLHDE